MSPSHLLGRVMLFPFLSSLTQAYQLAPLAAQSLQHRAAYQGGWALSLPGADCPVIAPVACSTRSGTVNPTCCPEGQLCDGTIYPYCCPTGSDCFSTVENLPVCANSTWNMYVLTGAQYFCCEPGQYGVLPTRGYAGLCVPTDQVVASSLVATAASQVGGAALTAGGNTNPVPTSATKTVTSTLKGGAVTTITTEVKSTATATATNVSNSGSGSSGSESGGNTNSSTKSKSSFSTGAKVGVAIGAVAVLLLFAFLLWKVLGARKSKRAAAVEGIGYGTGGSGGAPAYTPQAQQQTPVAEYKNPVTVQQGTVTGGGEWAGSPSPPPAQSQGGYVPPALTQQPVEAPSRWERRVEM
ncbi:hypothetical protein BKA65DRAFT_177219 [Rhexocercosporidium sp. MPI-PUGE-AT-0058]|nr:hypothetical protein BKA65DRAFT_177219 [Rhexocercosporidium sp. MPI-PUGE-AT-0058]